MSFYWLQVKRLTKMFRWCGPLLIAISGICDASSSIMWETIALWSGAKDHISPKSYTFLCVCIKNLWAVLWDDWYNQPNLSCYSLASAGDPESKKKTLRVRKGNFLIISLLFQFFGIHIQKLGFLFIAAIWFSSPHMPPQTINIIWWYVRVLAQMLVGVCLHVKHVWVCMCPYKYIG